MNDSDLEGVKVRVKLVVREAVCKVYLVHARTTFHTMVAINIRYGRLVLSAGV